MWELIRIPISVGYVIFLYVAYIFLAFTIANIVGKLVGIEKDRSFFIFFICIFVFGLLLFPVNGYESRDIESIYVTHNGNIIYTYYETESDDRWDRTTIKMGCQQFGDYEIIIDEEGPFVRIPDGVPTNRIAVFHITHKIIGEFEDSLDSEFKSYWKNMVVQGNE